RRLRNCESLSDGTCKCHRRTRVSGRFTAEYVGRICERCRRTATTVQHWLLSEATASAGTTTTDQSACTPTKSRGACSRQLHLQSIRDGRDLRQLNAHQCAGVE